MSEPSPYLCTGCNDRPPRRELVLCGHTLTHPIHHRSETYGDQPEPCGPVHWSPLTEENGNGLRIPD